MYSDTGSWVLPEFRLLVFAQRVEFKPALWKRFWRRGSLFRRGRLGRFDLGSRGGRFHRNAVRAGGAEDGGDS